MKIGIFGGSFDPVHTGHVHVVSEFLQKTDLQKIFVSPAFVSPFKIKNPPKASPEQRFTMLKKAFSDLNQIEIIPWELEQKNISYTIDLVKHLSECLFEDTLYLLLTDKTGQTLSDWKNFDQISEYVQYKFAYPHSKKDTPCSLGEKVLIDPINISSTEIRRKIAQGEDCQKFLHKDVWAFIQKNHLYI